MLVSAMRPVVACLIVFGAGGTVASAAPPPPDVPLPDAVWHLTEAEESLVLVGYSEQADYDVRLPAGWQVRSRAELRAMLVAGAEIRNDAAVRFDLDERPMYTWTRGDADEISIPVPAESFDDGALHVAISSTTPLDQEGTCRDTEHVGRWFDIGTPTVTGPIGTANLDVARAVAGIGPVSRLTTEPIAFVVPAGLTDTVLEAIGSITAAVAHHGVPSGWQIVSDQTEAPPGAQVRINERTGERASVSLDVVNHRPVLTFSGDPAGIGRLADALGDPDRAIFFHKERVTEADVPAVTTREAREVFTFAEAGYDDRTLRGFGSKSLIYRVHIPAGVPPETATLALVATMSPRLADHRAAISVKINGSDEEIVAVAESDGRVDALHTVTPADLRPGLNFVKITTELGAGPTECDHDSVPSWFTVADGSAVGVDRSNGPRDVTIGIEDARFALASAVDFDATDVAIPDEFELHDLYAALNLVSELASRSESGSPRLVRDSLVDRERHLVVTGRSNARSLLADVPHRDRDVGLVAATKSPFTTGRIFMAFTGQDAYDVALAVTTAMSSDVNDITEQYALVSIDAVRPVEAANEPEPMAAEQPEPIAAEQPEPIAAEESAIRRTAGPSEATYEEWLLEQAARIESARAPETSERRSTALVLGLGAAAVAAGIWLHRTRSNRDVAPGH